jgi:hypothetical protein
MATQGTAAPESGGSENTGTAEVVALDPGEEAPADRTAPARGIAIGLGLAALLWVAIISVWAALK